MHTQSNITNIKYYINKSHSGQITPTRAQNANQNPHGGMELMIKYPTPHMPDPPPPPVGAKHW
jgi:hypothetical protein